MSRELIFKEKEGRFLVFTSFKKREINEAVSRRSRTTTTKTECTKKRNARAKLGNEAI